MRYLNLGIVGSRDFTDYDLLEDYILLNLPVLLDDVENIVSGGADGTDTLAQQFANNHSIQLRIHRPKWNQYPGKSAAYHRNLDIVQDSDFLFIFWDGESPGTKMTIDICKKEKVPYELIMYKEYEKWKNQ